MKDLCSKAKLVKVLKVEQAPTYKKRPLPLNTVEAQKLVSRQLKISPAKCMEIMEKLYNRGFLSYPRTETNIYHKSINLREIVKRFEKEDGDFGFGAFASQLISGGMWGGARVGTKDDKAHPPIHPVKLASIKELETPAEQKVYELLVRHFLASVSKDAVGEELKVQVSMADEIFKASGLKVSSKNFLEVYKYTKWADKSMPTFQEGDELKPSSLTMREGKTTPPSPLTEADLIAQMDEHGIGTDATIHEHIKNIQLRGYAKKAGVHIVPTELGTALVETYKRAGLDLFKPELRAQMETDLTAIAEG